MKVESGDGVVMRVNYFWRLFATGACFTIFGLGAFLLSVLVFPVINLFSGARKSAKARWVIYKSFGLFLSVMQITGVLRLQVTGGEKLKDSQNVLVLANHPTLIDVVAIVSLMPNASCVVKQALWSNPFMWGVVRAANYISNSDPETLIIDCVSDIKTGRPLLIFPEGTRSVPEEPLHFKRGAAYIALNSKVPILPILVSCKPSTLTKLEKWYNIPKTQAKLTIEVRDIITIDRWVNADDPPAIAARKLTLGLEQYFTQELSIYENALP